MPPCDTPNRSAYRGLVDANLSGNGRHCNAAGEPFARLAHERRCELGQVLSLTESLSGPGPVLSPHVVDIVGIGSKEEMIRTNTTSVIAMMTDDKAGLDRAIMQEPGQPVRTFDDATADVHCSVSLGCPGGPFPAAITLSHLGPESSYVLGIHCGEAKNETGCNQWPQ